MVPQKQPNSAGHSVTLSIPDRNNRRRPCSIRLLPCTHDGAMNMPSTSLSPGIAASLD
jgi:hypothetical protein